MSNSNSKPTYFQLETQNRFGLLRATRRFLAELQSLSTRIAAVQEISIEINRSLNLDQILQVVGQQAKWLLDFDHCSMCLVQPDGSRQMIGLFGDSERSLALAHSNSVERALRSRQPQLLNNEAQPSCGCVVAGDGSSTGLCPLHAPWRSQLIIPLESEGEVLGTINFALLKPQGYSQEDLRIAYLLALQLATAIHNARRFEEVHRLYSELQEAYAELRQVEGLRDELTHMIVHDLRNPLSSIIVGLEMVDVVQANAVEQHRWVEIARTASYCMNGMIEDLLHLSKFEVGKLKPVLQSVDMTILLMAQVESYRAQAEMQNKHLVLQVPDSLPDVIADTNLISRVIDNLVSNALKYTEPGGLVEIGTQTDAESLQVYVRDDGQGIPAEYCDRIFDKFVQVTDAVGASLRKGTGLGLAFCRMAIEAHGGKIWVESINHQGSTFTFTLPFNVEAADPPILRLPQPSVGSSNHPIAN
ncbi:MAG: ATP-binding protein [Oculatellaceae cyanobacterium bins.114]|nr:ATP-binding protein [Oculatellaceae cyanobacterium bins.114]